MERPYQSRTIEAIRKAIGQGHKRILVVMPTGAGKGFVSARIMQKCSERDNNSIFFANQRELIFQLSAQLERLDIPCNVLMAGVKNEYEDGSHWSEAQKCSLVAKDTLWHRAFRSKKLTLPPGDVLQIDEAHSSITKAYGAIVGAYPESILIGWTATPCRADGRSMKGVFETMVQGTTYKELQADGFLVPVNVFAPHRPDLKGIKTSGGDYAKGELCRRMNKTDQVGDIVQEWAKNAQDRQTVAFLSGIDHSLAVRDRFRAYLGRNADGSERAEHLDGKTPVPERMAIMNRIREGSVKVLCNFGVAHTGVDVPAWKYMICARPTKSFALWRQMGGRIQRPFPGHDHCVIQDHSDNTLNFGFPDEDVEWLFEDTTTKIQDSHRKARERPPAMCKRCKVVFVAGKCPRCGMTPERNPEDVEMTPGELRKLERIKAQKQANKAATTADKQAYWDKHCLGWAIGTGKKIGAAAHRYKEHFGVFPNSQLVNVPRSLEWRMTAKQFYDDHVAPAREEARKQAVRDVQELLL